MSYQRWRKVDNLESLMLISWLNIFPLFFILKRRRTLRRSQCFRLQLTWVAQILGCVSLSYVSYPSIEGPGMQSNVDGSSFDTSNPNTKIINLNNYVKWPHAYYVFLMPLKVQFGCPVIEIFPNVGIEIKPSENVIQNKCPGLDHIFIWLNGLGTKNHGIENIKESH